MNEQTPRSPITQQLIADLEYRTRIGYSKYGRVLNSGVGKDPLLNAKEEVLDLAQYLQQEIIEKQELMGLLDNLFSGGEWTYIQCSSEFGESLNKIYTYYLHQKERTNDSY